MNYHRYIDLDVINGPGNRCTLFVSGCEHKCPGCYNASTWPADSGHPFTDAEADRIIDDLQDTRIIRRGLSLSGGDPLFPGNCEEVLKLVRRVKTECPGKDIWLWTGYRLENLSPAQKAVLEYVDVLVDGPFVQAKRDPSLLFRGSSNQRILDLTAEHQLAESA
ncbi:anaerobic ribonucleoside-triphosphate reductase-activating protein [Cerasicoccus maritimus]|uniref:anaerobic ribonucleoside-triphosphate reductase-activating protein n=1 Tax=Cerasicoccus maritimus TaxID=490089 RepID=UPI00285283B7|nr:anaerobic ribonucleoside-triphosphate reductase-activating protein [Cerasicoccus maritimus]